MAARRPTRQRLLDEGVRLFAARGFDGTTVGDIESAAGLQPRRGGLYKHFVSKDALLQAAVQQHLDDVATSAQQLRDLDLSATTMDLDILRPIVHALGQWFLDRLDRERDLTRVFEHEGERLQALAERVRADLVDAGNGAAAALLAAAAPTMADPEAMAALLLGSLVALRRTTWTFGAPPLGLDDARALNTWVELVVAATASRAARTERSGVTRTARQPRSERDLALAGGEGAAELEGGRWWPA